MADATVEYAWRCWSVARFERKVPGSKGQDHTVLFARTPKGPFELGWSCDCKGFKYRGKCSHAAKVQGERCGWDSVIDGGKPVKPSDPVVGGWRCPRCGNCVEPYKAA